MTAKGQTIITLLPGYFLKNSLMINRLVKVLPNPGEKLKNSKIFIIGYDFLTRIFSSKNKLFSKNFLLIIDESQYISNPNTKIFKVLYQIRKNPNCKGCILLTATPILHRPGELWTQVKLINPSFSISYQKFVDYFKKYDNGFNHYGLKNEKEFQKLINQYTIFVDYKKAKVKLPKLEIKPIYLEKGFNDRLETSLEKINITVEITKKLVKQGEKVLIFAWYRETVLKLKEKLKGQGIISLVYFGGLNHKQRKEIIEKFKSDKYQVLIGNIAALGVGANLQFCKRAIIHDLVWSPEEINQAIKRIHRIGSKEKVEVYVPLFKEGFDKKLLKNFLEKEDMIKKFKSVDINWRSVFNVKESLLDKIFKFFKS